MSGRVLGCAIEVHRELGPGLLESTYEQCMACELNRAGIPFKIQHPLPVLLRDFFVNFALFVVNKIKGITISA